MCVLGKGCEQGASVRTCVCVCVCVRGMWEEEAKGTDSLNSTEGIFYLLRCVERENCAD